MFEGTADVCDRLGDGAEVCELALVSYGGRHEVAGRIACIRVDEDAAPIRRMLEQEGQGRVLIVDGCGSRQVALLGDRMARLALSNGWAGVVIHGAVRDVAALEQIDLAVFALGTVPRRAQGGGTIEAEAPVSFGGVTFAPGDWVVLDRDGLVVVAPPALPPSWG